MSWPSYGAFGIVNSVVGILLIGSLRRLRIQEDEFGRDDKLVVFCARLEYIQPGWRLVRLMNLAGKFSGATLLVRFEISDAE